MSNSKMTKDLIAIKEIWKSNDLKEIVKAINKLKPSVRNLRAIKERVFFLKFFIKRINDSKEKHLKANKLDEVNECNGFITRLKIQRKLLVDYYNKNIPKHKEKIF